MNFFAFIPARYGSSRFPGKPLASICDKPMIQWVYEAVASVPQISKCYVATDDERIFKCVKEFGGNAIMTSPSHTCGSERINECREILNLKDEDIILNIQGDEPLIKKEMINDLISAFENESVYMATLKKKITDHAEINNFNVVKVVTDKNQDALFFSRYAIPYNRDNREDVCYYKHIGIYGYKAGFLKEWSVLEKSFLEKAESLEQLRVLENGYKIRVRETEFQSLGVDTPEQIEEVERYMRKNNGK